MIWKQIPVQKKIRIFQLPAALILSLILALSFSCNTSTETVAGLSLDSLNQADAKMQAYVDEGKFQLDDPVADYIPEFAETKVWVDGEEVAQQEAFTIRHLLTHTAGFCYGWDGSHVDSLYARASPEGL